MKKIFFTGIILFNLNLFGYKQVTIFFDSENIQISFKINPLLKSWGQMGPRLKIIRNGKNIFFADFIFSKDYDAKMVGFFAYILKTKKIKFSFIAASTDLIIPWENQ